MSGTTWTKFYWSDWESDPALRLCSLAAQGLWMRMLCIASAHDPIGYVAVAGRGLDETALARMTGCSESEVSDLLGELDRNGVFSRDRNGRIYSRRMVADAKKAAIARKNGKNGGNPSLRKDRGNPASDNPPDKGCLKPQEPEASIQKDQDANASLSTPSRATTYPEPFEAAWKAYPHVRGRSSKPKALGIWRRMDAATRQALPSAIARYAREGREPREKCGAPAMERWLRDARFEAWLTDEQPTIRPGPVDPAVEAHRLAHWRRTGEWKREWGERPLEAA